MFCTRCGRAIEERDSFCPGCGSRISIQPGFRLPSAPKLSGLRLLIGVLLVILAIVSVDTYSDSWHQQQSEREADSAIDAAVEACAHGNQQEFERRERHARDVIDRLKNGQSVIFDVKLDNRIHKNVCQFEHVPVGTELRVYSEFGLPDDDVLLARSLETLKGMDRPQHVEFDRAEFQRNFLLVPAGTLARVVDTYIEDGTIGDKSEVEIEEGKFRGVRAWTDERHLFDSLQHQCSEFTDAPVDR